MHLFERSCPGSERNFRTSILKSVKMARCNGAFILVVLLLAVPLAALPLGVDDHAVADLQRKAIEQQVVDAVNSDKESTWSLPLPTRPLAFAPPPPLLSSGSPHSEGCLSVHSRCLRPQNNLNTAPRVPRHSIAASSALSARAEDVSEASTHPYVRPSTAIACECLPRMPRTDAGVPASSL